MSRFSHRELPGNCHAIDDGDKTVAIVSGQGAVDWLLRSPRDEGPRVERIAKETHLDYTLGVKLELKSQHPMGQLRALEIKPGPGGRSVNFKSSGESRDGLYHFACEANLYADGKGSASRYYWDHAMTIQYVGKEPDPLMKKRPKQRPFFEFNNVYPSRTGKGMFHAKEKEYTHTLISDADGVIWSFPHQATMHYGGAIDRLRFEAGQETFGSFAGFSEGALKMTVQESTLPPTWGICDMYKDMHCCTTAPKIVRPGESFFYKSRIEFFSVAEGDALLQKSRPIPISPEARQRNADVVRFDPGNNSFLNPVHIDRPDETSGFRPSPPEKVWVRMTDLMGKGALQLTNETDQPLIWTALPSSQLKPSSKLNIRGRIKTENVTGKGAYIRYQYTTFKFHPKPERHVEAIMKSEAIRGSSAGWIEVSIPQLDIPAEHFDYLITFAFVLEGKGRAWLTDVDIDLDSVYTDLESLQIDMVKTACS